MAPQPPRRSRPELTIHIVTCSPSYLPEVGGAEVGLHEVLRRLTVASNHRITVVTATTDLSCPPRAEIDGVEVVRYIRPDRWARWYGPTIAAWRNLPSILERLEPDLLHIAYILPSGLAAASWARRHGVPYVVSVVGSDIADPFIRPPLPLRLLADRAIHRSPHVVANSTAVMQIVSSKLSKRATRHVIFLGVDTDRFSPGIRSAARRVLGLPQYGPIVLALQRLERRKGIDVLLHAFQDVLKAVPEARLVIYGRGREGASLARLSHELGLGDAVLFAGYIDDASKPEAYRAADVFVLASHYEGLGIVLAEAASTGVPVVATSEGGTRDFVIDGTTGRLVPPGRPDVLSEVLVGLLKDQSRCSAMGRAGREHITSKANINDLVARYKNVFEAAAVTRG